MFEKKEQKTDKLNNTTRKVLSKRSEPTTIRFNRVFMKQIGKLVDKANKKQFGRKIRPGAIVENIFKLIDESLIDKAIKKTQEESLRPKDKKEIFLKENLGKFKGTKEEFEEKMMELMGVFISQNLS